MLRISRLTDRSGRYYLADLAVELGPAPFGSTAGAPSCPHGLWTGAGAAGLGLSGAVAGVDLAAVLSGLDPRSARSLRPRSGLIAGYDLVFAAPKSVSILHGLGDAVPAASALEAHRSAVDAAVGYVARRAAGVRVGSGSERRTDPLQGLVAARFDHGVSRALDPHLHTHVVLANMGQGPDGRWRALDGRGLDAHTRAAGAIYDAHLRHALAERTGARWARRRSGACELAAIDPVLVGALSGRAAAIRQRLHTHTGPSTVADGAWGSSSRARSVAWAATREPKAATGDRAPAVLRRRWERCAADVGWERAELSHALADLGPPEGRAVVDEHRFAGALHERTLHGGATRRDVVAAWASALVPGAPAVDVERCVDSLAHWGVAVGVAEPVRQRSEVVASSRAVQALGPRPGAPASLTVWQGAAREIDRAHGRGISLGDLEAAPDQGGGRAALSRLPVGALAARLELERVVAEARRRLGLDRNPPRRDAGRAIGRG